MKIRAGSIAVAFVLLCSILSWGQANFGEIKGFITDDQGNAVLGASVKVNSDALMGERTTTSGARGYYRLINLPPGLYVVTISKENYETTESKEISVRAEKVTILNVGMKVGNFEQTVVITGNASIIDPEASGQKFQVTGDFQNNLPLNERRNYHEILRAIPGVVLTYNIDAVYAYYRVHGANDYSGNMWMIDGAQSTAWSSGYAGSTNINTDIIDDTSIQMSGLSASQPLGQGASINFVTKSGGNELSGSSTLQYQPKKWNDTNVDGGTPANQEFTQASAALGGPIIKDKLWFFGSYRFTGINQGLSRTAQVVQDMKDLFPGWEPFDLDKKLHTYFVKGTYQINDSNSVLANYQRDWGPETFGGGNRTKSALIDEGGGGPFEMLSWTTAIGSDLSITSSVSYRDKPRYRHGRTPNDTPAIIISGGWYQSGSDYYGSPEIAYDGNYRTIYQENITSWEAKSDANYYLEDLYGSHEVEFGFYAQPSSEYQLVYDYSRKPAIEYRIPIDLKDYSKGTRVWGRQYYDGDQQEYAKLIGRNYAGYINDTWKPNERLTITAGLRWDHIGASDELNGNRQNTFSTDAITPVIGVTYMVTADGENVVRANYRRSSDSFRSGLLPTSGQAAYLGRHSEYDLNGDGIFEIQTSVPPSVAAPNDIDYSDRSLPYSHDLTFGYTRELGWGMTVSVDYTYRQFRNFLYTLNTNPIYENGQFVGMRDPSVSAIYKYTNNTWNWRQYQGLDIQINKRLSNDLQFMASMSDEWSELKGDWAPDDPYKYISPEKFASFGEGNGTTQSFKPQGPNFRFNAVWNTPWYGIVASVSTIHNKGQWSGPVYENLTSTDPEVLKFGPRLMQQGGYTIVNPLYQTRRLYFGDRNEGQWRSPMDHKVNIRFGKEFRFEDRYRAEIAVDVFNLFNWDSAYYTHYYGNDFNYTDSRTGAKYYGTNRGTQAPRSAQLFVRFSF